MHVTWDYSIVLRGLCINSLCRRCQIGLRSCVASGLDVVSATSLAMCRSRLKLDVLLGMYIGSRCLLASNMVAAKCHTNEELRFCHCSLIISSHVPVNENMKNLSCLSDSNCSISPAAICVLNNLFRYCMKVGPATMLFASCSTGSL